LVSLLIENSIMNYELFGFAVVHFVLFVRFAHVVRASHVAHYSRARQRKSPIMLPFQGAYRPVQNPRRCLGLGYKRLSAFAPLLGGAGMPLRGFAMRSDAR
jgi:hypothetical protein